jgi:TonB-dependent receptor
MSTTKFCTKPLVVAIAAAISIMGFATVAVAQDANGVGNQVTQNTSQAGSTPQQDRATGTPAQAAQEKKATELQGIVVEGVRASQMKSVEIKRTAPSIQDSITAENIGQLPDITISDSLQRITGVQIGRSAGEGSSVNVRGLPEVGTTINGEAFITAGQIVSQQPDFATIPSQLFSGTDVVKSSTASMANSGITGTINLRTRRPWDMDPGWTFAGTVNGSYGDATKKYEPEANGLISYNANGRWGALVSVAYSDVTHEESESGNDEQGGLIFGENAASATSSTGFLGSFGSSPIPSDIHQLGGGNVDVNGNGTANDAFYGSHAAFGNTSSRERKRLGINASVQGDLGSGFTVTGDGFFSRMDDYSHNNEFELFSASYRGSTFVPIVSQDTGRLVNSSGFASDQQQEFHTTQVYRKWPGDIETYSRVAVTNSVARNFNLALNYDNGGAFTGDFRVVNASAHELLMNSYAQYSLSDGTQWPNSPFDAAPPGTYIVPGGTRVFNPNGLPPNSVPIEYDMRGTNMAVSLPAGIQNFLNDPNNYALKAISSDNNHERQTGMNIVRADGHYDFGGFKFVDSFKLNFGVRNSIRSASNTDFHLVAPLYAGNGASDPNGCLVRWKAADVVMNGGGVDGACTAGNSQGYFRSNMFAGLAPGQLPATLGDNFHMYKNLGNVDGINIYNLDPKVMDDPLAFQNSLYPGEQRSINPGGAWNLLLKETTGYLQADFAGDAGSVPYAGNIGARFIRTNLHVVRRIVGARPPYGVSAQDNGMDAVDRQYTDVLPAVNLAFDLTPKLKLRGAYTKNMMPLDLDQWGGGLTLGYDIDTSTPGSTRFVVQGGSSSGNPNLDPWRSSNYDLSLEYYINPTNVISLAAFYVKVESFIKNGSVLNCALPDLDGTVSGRCVPISGPIQGEGKSLHGLEFDYKQAFTFLPGWLTNTGMDVNFTYSPSDGGNVDLAGNKVPFQDNSKESGNLVFWYEDSRFQARVAGNYRSTRAVSEDFSGIKGMEVYQAPTTYVDASVSYKLTPHVQIFLQGQNLTNEHERYYLVWPSQVAHTTEFERRYMLGVRANF